MVGAGGAPFLAPFRVLHSHAVLCIVEFFFPGWDRL